MWPTTPSIVYCVKPFFPDLPYYLSITSSPFAGGIEAAVVVVVGSAGRAVLDWTGLRPAHLLAVSGE